MRANKNNPSNSMIERLLKDLWQYLPEKYKDDAETEKLRIEESKLEEKLLSNPKLKALQKKIKSNVDKRVAKHEAMSNEIRYARTMFLAHGASKDVLSKLQKLAEKFSKEKA